VRISVVIPTRDKAARLRLTLACLAGQVGVERPEVVVVDDGSIDATAAVLAEAEGLSLIAMHGAGRGRAAARNLGAQQAHGDRLVFLDDDILVGPNFLTAHLEAGGPEEFVHGRLRELPAAERLVAALVGAAPSRIRALRAMVHSGDSDDPRHRLKANALERTVEQMHCGSLPDVAPWLGCVGANVSMTRAAWHAVGGFDEGFGRRWGCEDLELGLRLHQAGFTRQLAPEALGVHLTHRREQRWTEHAPSMDRFLDRHPLAAVRHLGYLLSAAGDPAGYVDRVRAEETP
jgi:glycosyltransferase involved in cell wall biosynthesis